MTLWSKILGRDSNEYIYLREAFANHHHTAREELDRHHPHALGTLELHGVDLKTIRKRAATVVAAAAIAGLLLARPHAVGAPVTDKQQEEHTQIAGLSQTGKPVENVTSSKPSSVTNLQTPVPEPPVVSEDQKPKIDKRQDETHGHKGHTRGRSDLAPPKEHGLHDLGLHKGDENEHPIKEHQGKEDSS